MAVTQSISPSVFHPKPSPAKLCIFDEISSSLPFPRAAELYMEMLCVGGVLASKTGARYVSDNTMNGYKRHRSSLRLFFENTGLEAITIRHLREYQAARAVGAEPFIRRRRSHEEPGPCPCKPQQINQELGFLRAVMRRSGCKMADLDKHYKELQESQAEIPRALSPEEHTRWLEISRTRERWLPIHWYSVLALESTMSTNEIRGLRIGDVDLEHRKVNVPWPAAKNKYRHRSITLDSADSIWACERLIERANKFGAHAPQHYLFPFRETRRSLCNPDTPMTSSGLKRLWQEVRDATGLPWFRLYDTRHTAITRMAEAGVSIHIIMAKAGHVSFQMSQHYTHISEAAQRQWTSRPTPGARLCAQPHDSNATQNRVEADVKLRQKGALYGSTTFTYAGQIYS